MRPLPSLLSLTLLLCAGAGCHPQGTGPQPAYEGCATDENWVTFDDYIATGRAKTDAQAGPTWLEPAGGATLPSSAPPAFRFQPSPTVSGSANGDASCPQFSPQSLNRRTGLVPLHLPPVSGTVFDVHFAVDGADAFRVLTTKQSAGVPAATWKSWAGKRVAVTLYKARLLQNEVVEGPYRAAPLELSVGP
jgi:hypothetical protein